MTSQFNDKVSPIYSAEGRSLPGLVVYNCWDIFHFIVMSNKSYDQLPNRASLEVAPFPVHVAERDLQDLKDLLRMSKLGPETYENTRPDGKFGVTHEWMKETKAYWEKDFDW